MHKKIRPCLVLFALLLALPGCATQRTFSSPDDAAGSLVSALRTGDREALKDILGATQSDLLSSGDGVADRNSIDKFLEAYDEKHMLVPGGDGQVTMIVGNTDWPLPIPIVKEDGKDKWRFDSDAGKQEIINRRIGRNELDTIQVCLAIVDAQREYATTDANHNNLPEYAMRFLSDPGTRNGLYWPTGEGEKPSPLGPLIASAQGQGYSRDQANKQGRVPFHGYFYRMLTAQGRNAPGGARDYLLSNQLIGGFAVVAFPADYGSSGVMTFLVNHEGIVYQCDLGRNTDRIAERMTTFNPDANWTKVDPPAQTPE